MMDSGTMGGGMGDMGGMSAAFSINGKTWPDVTPLQAKLGTPLDGHAGKWLIHCHILAHAERGMMTELDVAP